MNHYYFLRKVKGKRLIIASELEEGMRLNTAMVKQLCSTDEIYAEKKYKDPFSFTPSHTLVLYTNHLPRVGASDSGTWRRLIVIPFNAKIEGSSDIRNYADYLFKEAAEAIMQWIIEGAEEVIRQDYDIKFRVLFGRRFRLIGITMTGLVISWKNAAKSILLLPKNPVSFIRNTGRTAQGTENIQEVRQIFILL